jgi:branched-chain amino acid transport system substrate-binding protein
MRSRDYCRGVKVLLVVLLALLTACPRGTRKTVVPDVPQNGDAQARSRFQSARAKFNKDGGGAAEFRDIVDDYPDDPIVPWAQLYAGIAAVKERKFDIAATELAALLEGEGPEGLRARAELFLGITKNYQGDWAKALPLLRKGEKAIEGDAERTEYLAAYAYATAASDRPLGALGVFDQLYGRVSPTEKALIVARLEEVVAAADPNTLKRAYDEIDDRKGPSMAVVASRLAVLADQAGKTSEAQSLRQAAAPARAAVGLPRTINETPATVGGSGDAGLVGAVVPLGGNANRVGEAAVAGLGVAAGVSDGKGVAAPHAERSLMIEVRAASDKDAAALAVEELAKANVIAIIGPIDSDSVEQAAQRAESLGIPLLSLSPRPERVTSGRFIFHVRHSSEARARALAQRALAKGVTKFAVLAPETNYGKSVTEAFVSEVKKGGGSIATTVTYPKDTKSFGSFAKKLGDNWQGVFVPEEADRLILITPALAATGNVPKPVGTKKVSGGRPVLLLSTAEGLSGDYLNNAGRQSEGALFAPGYYPDDQDPNQKVFLDRFIAAYGKAPGATEAYAYDAAQLAASANGGGRGGLAATLAKGQLVGITGTIQFDQDHRRADLGVIYTVTIDGGVNAIRVAK